jgi:hypothetical protein
MSFSDETQEYLLVRPPQSNKLGRGTARNLQVQRLLPSSPQPPRSRSPTPTSGSPHRHRIKPILNLDSHIIGKSRIVETDSATTLCKFDREPNGVLGKWQVDVRRGEGGGWIFVGKYERYEWAKSRGHQGEESWKLVQSTYSHSKAAAASGGGTTKKDRRKSHSRASRPSMDDTSPERRLNAKITIIANSPPSVVIMPRNPRSAAGGRSGENNSKARTDVDEGIEMVNKEEVINALIQGLWIVWREGVVDYISSEERNTWAPKGTRIHKRGIMDLLLCRS